MKLHRSEGWCGPNRRACKRHSGVCFSGRLRSAKILQKQADAQDNTASATMALAAVVLATRHAFYPGRWAAGDNRSDLLPFRMASGELAACFVYHERFRRAAGFMRRGFRRDRVALPGPVVLAATTESRPGIRAFCDKFSRDSGGHIPGLLVERYLQDGPRGRLFVIRYPCIGQIIRRNAVGCNDLWDGPAGFSAQYHFEYRCAFPARSDRVMPATLFGRDARFTLLMCGHARSSIRLACA